MARTLAVVIGALFLLAPVNSAFAQTDPHEDIVRWAQEHNRQPGQTVPDDEHVRINCPKCRGTGIYTKQTGGQFGQSLTTTCPQCGGKGWIIKVNEAAVQRRKEREKREIRELLYDREDEPSQAPPPLHSAASSGAVDQVQQRLAAGDKIESRDDINGWTPLHYAVYSGKLDVVRLLLDRGASVDSVTPVAKVTPLMLASNSTKEVATLLLDKGANVNASSPSGSPLDFAAWKGNADVTAVLLARGANVGSRDEIGNTPLNAANSFETRKLLIIHGAAVNTVNIDGTTPLHVACSVLDVESVKLLLANGANVNAVAKDGTTPLMNVINAKAAREDFEKVQTPRPGPHDIQVCSVCGGTGWKSKEERQRIVSQLSGAVLNGGMMPSYEASNLKCDQCKGTGYEYTPEFKLKLEAAQREQSARDQKWRDLLIAKQAPVLAVLQLFGVRGSNRQESDGLAQIGRAVANAGSPSEQKAEIAKAYKVEAMVGAPAGQASAAPTQSQGNVTPEQEKAAEAALQMADNYQSVKRADLARAKYESIIAQYPATQAAKKAKERLNAVVEER